MGARVEAGLEASTVSDVSESLRLTIVYEQGEDGFIVSSVPEVHWKRSAH